MVHGTLHCSDRQCWLEFPVIDGAPVIVMNPQDYVRDTLHHLNSRADIPLLLESIFGDVVPSADPYNAARHHLSLYAGDHYGDWSGMAEGSQVAETMREGCAMLGGVAGPALDLGGSVGRGAFALAGVVEGPVLGADMSFPMIRLAQTLLREGRVEWSRRKLGTVYERMTATLPEDTPVDRVDFWILDAMALPFPAGRFGLVAAINLVDCIPGPTNMLSEVARMLAPGGGGFLTTPYDWSEQATEREHWLGGHSQRSQWGGESGPVLRATLDRFGLEIVAERDGHPWKLTVHDRSTMHYSLEMIAFRRHGG